AVVVALEAFEGRGELGQAAGQPLARGEAHVAPLAHLRGVALVERALVAPHRRALVQVLRRAELAEPRQGGVALLLESRAEQLDASRGGAGLSARWLAGHG